MGWASLSDAELPVVRLAAEGRANAEIAAELFLSRYTVETHLKHAFAKLGVESRAELAALAAGLAGRRAGDT
jgi:DNA-binding CsgD family transcriptional regulator